MSKISNQIRVVYFKEIADIIGIKKITWYDARLTIAITVTLENGIKIVNDSSML